VANTRSAKKRIRSQARKHIRNRTVRSAVKTAVARSRKDLAAGGTEVGSLPETISLMDRAAAKGILHPNNAARRKARLMRLLSRQRAGAAVAAPAPKRSRGTPG
jgi:small subunit ribosomal protein S20